MQHGTLEVPSQCRRSGTRRAGRRAGSRGGERSAHSGVNGFAVRACSGDAGDDVVGSAVHSWSVTHRLFLDDCLRDVGVEVSSTVGTVGIVAAGDVKTSSAGEVARHAAAAAAILPALLGGV